MRAIACLFRAAAITSAATAFAASGGTNLRLAISKCQVDVTRQLLDGGADVNATDERGEPIIRWLASGRSGCTDADALEVAKVLDEHGARFDRSTAKAGPSLLVNLAPRRMPRTLAFLAAKRGAGDVTDGLRAIAKSDDLESMRILLEAGANPTDGAAMGSALMDAALAGRAESVAEMMRHVKDKQSPKVIAAYEAARRSGHEPVAEVFTRAGMAPPPPPARPACQPRGLTAEESSLLARVGVVDGAASCKFLQECGDEILIDCNSAADGPAYYIDRRAARVLATCGGACMRGCGVSTEGVDVRVPALMTSVPLYVSAFEVLQEVAPHYIPIGSEIASLFDTRHPPNPAARLALPPGAVALLVRLKEGGVPFTLFSDFWSYETIEREVAASCGLLAIVDEYYLTSTGKMTELAYARREKPVFVFPAEARSAQQFWRNQRLPSATLLSDDPRQAYDQVVEVLRRAGSAA